MVGVMDRPEKSSRMFFLGTEENGFTLDSYGTSHWALETQLSLLQNLEIGVFLKILIFCGSDFGGLTREGEPDRFHSGLRSEQAQNSLLFARKPGTEPSKFRTFREHKFQQKRRGPCLWFKRLCINLTSAVSVFWGSNPLFPCVVGRFFWVCPCSTQFFVC